MCVTGECGVGGAVSTLQLVLKTDRTKRQLKTPRNTAKESEEKDYNERWIRGGVRYVMKMGWMGD